MNFVALGLVMAGVAMAADGPAYGPAPQAPHQITYSPKSVGIGEVVTLNGYPFQIQRLPLVDFEGGRYTFKYPAYLLTAYVDGLCANLPADCLYPEVFYFHSEESITPMFFVDGYPARFEMYEQRDPWLDSDGEQFLSGTTVHGKYFMTVEIGSAHLVLSLPYYFSLPPVPVGSQPKGDAGVKWSRLEDEADLPVVFDQWIDYVRIYRLR